MTVSELKYLIAVNHFSENGLDAKLTSIATSLGVTKVSVYKAVERLETVGYLSHNGKKICVTDKGKELLSEYMIVVHFISSHLEYHCGTPKDLAFNDALGAACAFSDTSRRNVMEFIKAGKRDR